MYTFISILVASLIILNQCMELTACEGECVPIACDTTKVINGEEKPLFDLRFQFNECDNVLDVCCRTESKKIVHFTPKKKSTKQCGIRHTEGVGFRITGGTNGESQYGELSWTLMVLSKSMVFDELKNVYIGAASLITLGVALTVAHILEKAKKSEIFIRAGEWDAAHENELFPVQERRVAQVMIHEKYNKQYDNNIALLVFDRPIDIQDDHISLICLPTDVNYNPTNCLTGGWGEDALSRKSMTIMKNLELPIVNRNECEEALRTTKLGRNFVLHESYICAGGEENVDTCKGDGGSPLICPGPNGIYYQIGIVAWGVGCGQRGIPGAYTNVPMFMSWIEEKLQVLPSYVK